MNSKAFGRTGRSVSEIGMGTYYDPLWIATAFAGWRREAPRKIAAIKAGLSGGVTLVDTAEIYRSEPLVAEAIKDMRREDIFLATKAWSNHLHRDALKGALEKSLRRLRTTYVDLYQVHFPNLRVPISETMAAMEDLVRGGKITHVGVSNFTIEQIKEANTSLPKSQLTSVQLSYNLLDRHVESEILPYCQREGVALLAYFPLAHGRLASDPRLASLGMKYDKTASQVALRWLAGKEAVFPIPRASSLEHVTEDVNASGWEIARNEAAELERTFS
ncbi:MAG: aldo/keto reductase [Nitrososphaerales archaeon]|nr:aldo/keto reductase [Nitrososphaerales archaeon]